MSSELTHPLTSSHPTGVPTGVSTDVLSESPPVLVLVGRTNVGKSTLFNRLTRSRDALVAAIPGLTRDRHYGMGRMGLRPFMVVDTGGLEAQVLPHTGTSTARIPPPSAPHPHPSGLSTPLGLSAEVVNQVTEAISESDLVIFVIDGRDGLLPGDWRIAQTLRQCRRPVVIVANKMEGTRSALFESQLAEMYALGFGKPYPISAAHGDYVSDFIDEVLSQFPSSFLTEGEALGDLEEHQSNLSLLSAERGDQLHATRRPRQTRNRSQASKESRVSSKHAPPPINNKSQDQSLKLTEGEEGVVKDLPYDLTPGRVPRVAVAGRPNVGKSTLVNALLGEERMVVYDEPGTTRDAIATAFKWQDTPYVLVDTAGLRRRGRVQELAEKFSVIKTMQAIEAADVVILMLDAHQDISLQDAHIAQFIIESGRALVVGVNKWDGLSAYERQQVRDVLARQLHFLSFAHTCFISARQQQGLNGLMQQVVVAYQSAIARISTPRINRLLREAVSKQAPPRAGVFRPQLRYAHQGGNNPPVIVVHGNSLQHIPDSYTRYLEGYFRTALKLQGTPIRVQYHSGRNPYQS